MSYVCGAAGSPLRYSATTSTAAIDQFYILVFLLFFILNRMLILLVSFRAFFAKEL
jgi:hypothetical protein